MTPVRIRRERAEDRGSALAVERAAFGSEEEAQIVRTVADEPGSFAFVAVDDGEVIGHVQCSRAWVGEQPVVALGPIGVVPERRGAGVGSDLVRAALQEAADRGEVAVMLLGAPGFYGPLGFRPGADLGLRNPYAGEQEDGFVIQEEDFQVAVFEDRAPKLNGTVRWHRAFGEVG